MIQRPAGSVPLGWIRLSTHSPTTALTSQDVDCTMWMRVRARCSSSFTVTRRGRCFTGLSSSAFEADSGAVAERQPKRVHALVIGDTWAWPADNRTMVLFSKILGGRLGRSLILRYNLFARVSVPGGVKRHTMSDSVRLHSRRSSRTVSRASRRPSSRGRS